MTAKGKARAARGCVYAGAAFSAGVLVLLLSIPSWLWATLLGILLTSVGFLIWRFS